LRRASSRDVFRPVPCPAAPDLSSLVFFRTRRFVYRDQISLLRCVPKKIFPGRNQRGPTPASPPCQTTRASVHLPTTPSPSHPSITFRPPSFSRSTSFSHWPLLWKGLRDESSLYTLESDRKDDRKQIGHGCERLSVGLLVWSSPPVAL